MDEQQAETFSDAINERAVQDAMWRAIDALREARPVHPLRHRLLGWPPP